MTLGEIIKLYRKEHGLSQRQFAERCGDVTNGYISMVEVGRNPATGKPIIPSIDKLYSFARGMGISLHQLVEKADDMPVYIGEGEPPDDIQLPQQTAPLTEEARIIAAGVDKLPADKRRQALKVFEIIFLQFAENGR